jgi:hypothetical protein
VEQRQAPELVLLLLEQRQAPELAQVRALVQALQQQQL